MQQAPNAGGVMDLTDAQRQDIRLKLLKIRDAFTPSDESPICDTFQLVAQYNRVYVGSEINGDTAEFILAGE